MLLKTKGCCGKLGNEAGIFLKIQVVDTRCPLKSSRSRAALECGSEACGAAALELFRVCCLMAAQGGSVRQPTEKPLAFRPIPDPSSISAQAGRLSLPACAEEVLQDARPSERRSLSARQAAEPQVIVHRVERNLDKGGPRACPPPGHPRGVPLQVALQETR